ncbi:MAG: hypothetical protein ABWJ42_01750 [Sulfolobales archaeon]
MEISFVSRDITPRPGIRLGGYGHRFGRPSTYKIDPLKLSILEIVDRRGEEIVIIQTDLLGLYREDADRIREIVSKRLYVDPRSVMIATTHTHSAPETVIRMWNNTFPYSREEEEIYRRWSEYLLERVREGLEELTLRRENVKRIKTNSARVNGLCYNRAFADGEIDNELSILYFESDRERIVIASYACHPVTNTGFGISADYPGVVREILERNGLKTVFLTGATGDIDPLSKGIRYMSYIGRTLASEILRLVENGETDHVDKVSTTSREEVFSVRKPERDLDDILRSYYTMLAQYPSIEDLYSDPNWADLLYLDEEIDLARDSRREVKTIFQGVEIGSKTVVLGVPGELFSETSIYLKESIRRERLFENIIMSTYTNDYIGYIPIERAFRERRYEARLAKWSFLREDAEYKTREVLMSIARELRKNNSIL